MHIDEVRRRLGEVKSYSEDFGLNLNKSEDRFKWFITSILFAKRISSKIASRKFRKFMEEGLTIPQNIIPKQNNSPSISNKDINKLKLSS